MNYNIKTLNELVLNQFPFERCVEYNDFNDETVFNYMGVVDLPSGWNWETGASKLVIIPDDNYDFVIKIPFNSSSEPTVDWDDDEFYPLECARLPITGGYSFDYCQSETEYYELAIEEGVSMFFAETIYLGDYGGYPVYLQEKCEKVYSKREGENPTPKQVKQAKELYANNYGIGSLIEKFIYYMLEKYEKESVEKFSEFLENCGIGDLHSGNYGYSAIDGRPILFDFSGYNE